MMPSNGQLTVPPGFRFHPTDEELLYYYLRKKVSFEDIDLDVIREVDLNKLEPWDLKEKCRIGSGPQNDWYFFSHKDKKYPTGTRTNRATIAGFWKATGRDKVIYLTNSKKIGMRKTLVFYTGRAPHGQKSDWIMHEYRLDDHTFENQEDGWVVCRVFKKKNYNRSYQVEMGQEEDDNQNYTMKASGSYNHHHNAQIVLDHQSKQNQHIQALYDYGIDGSMYLPQLFSQETTLAAQAASRSTLPFISPPLLSLNTTDLDCSQNLLRLTSNPNSCGTGLLQQNHPLHHQRFNGSDWSFLDKLLASHHSTHTTQLNQQQQQQQVAAKCSPSSTQVANYNHAGSSSSQIRFPFQYLGCEAADVLKFSNKSSS